MDLITGILAATLAAATPVIYASIGEIFAERSGILNLGLEGIMLLGAVAAYITAIQTASLGLAFLMAMVMGAVTGLLYAFLTITLQANQVVSGLALVTVGTGLSGFLGTSVFGIPPVVVFLKQPLPLLSQIPFFGPVFFCQDLMVYVLYFLVPLACIFIYKTRPGLKLRAIGANPEVLDSVGVHVFALRYIYVTLGCILCALGGAYVTLAYTPGWNDNIMNGRGWIAAALVIFASWNPAFAALGAVLFGGMEAVGLRMQVMGINISSYFLKMLPYVCTVFVLVISTGSFRKRKLAMPAALGQYYDREAR
jgi:simple sugar transport system permease protein